MSLNITKKKKSALPPVTILIHLNKFIAKHILVKIQLTKVSQKHFI